MDQYVEVTCIVDGALDETILVSDGTIFECEYGDSNDYVGRSFIEWLDDLQNAEVYVLLHDHNYDGEECACAQYETDHRPMWTFGSDSEDDDNG